MVPVDLVGALKEFSNGADPYDLLMAAGYNLENIEAFYAALARAVELGDIVEIRPSSSSVLLRVA